MNQVEIKRIEYCLEHVNFDNVGGLVFEMVDSANYTYQSNFTHPQLSNEMLYIGHFLDLPLCLDLGCPGAVHVLTGERQGLADEWDWFKSFGEALGKAQRVEEEKINQLELKRQNDIYWDWPE